MITISHDYGLTFRTVSYKRFEQLFDIEYFTHSRFDSQETEEAIRAACSRQAKRRTMPPYFKWLGAYYARWFEEPPTDHIALQWMHECIGYGVFTRKPLPAGAFIGEYTGLVRRRPLLFPDLNPYCFMYPLTLFLKPVTIDSESTGNFTRFINHSDAPNLESVCVFFGGVYHIVLRTLHPLPAGTELTYDYGELFWERRHKLHEFKKKAYQHPNDN